MTGNAAGENGINLSLDGRGGTVLSADEKTACLARFLKTADRLPARYFITNTGFRIGMPPQQAIDRYGKPTRIETTSEGKLYVWDFAADPAIPGVKTKEDEAYAKNSYGYHLKILFDNERAAAILMSSDVP